MIRLPYCLRRSERRPCKIPHWGGIRYKLECLCENFYIRYAKLPKRAIGIGQDGNPRIIVSLTTFPERINSVLYAIKSLMLQSVKPDKIILWLAKTQFDSVPNELKPYIENGLEIRFCDDLRSHKKYFYALQEQRFNEVVITYDDDIIYEKDSIKKLIHYHRLYPNCIICNRAQKILLGDNGFEPFPSWPIFNNIKKGVPTLGMIPSTGAGCLYPYGIMPPITFNRDLIMSSAFTTDDLWIGFVNINHGNRVVKTLNAPATLINVGKSQTESLTSINDLGGENMRAIERLLKVFPQTLQKLRDEN